MFPELTSQPPALGPASSQPSCYTDPPSLTPGAPALCPGTPASPPCCVPFPTRHAAPACLRAGAEGLTGCAFDRESCEPRRHSNDKVPVQCLLRGAPLQLPWQCTGRGIFSDDCCRRQSFTQPVLRSWERWHRVGRELAGAAAAVASPAMLLTPTTDAPRSRKRNSTVGALTPSSLFARLPPSTCYCGAQGHRSRSCSSTGCSPEPSAALLAPELPGLV